MQEHPLYADTLNHYLSLLTVIGAIVITLAAIGIAYHFYKGSLSKYGRYLGDYVYPIGFFVTLAGSFLTLFYSEVLKYAPCDLCWYQRIFLYPQIFLFAYAWYKKDRAVLPYTIILSIVGLCIATYHHLLQIGFDIMKPCSSAPFAVDCSKPSFIEFGFVTFPFMAVVLFGFLLVLTVTATQAKK